jgi:hypothetical protein
MIEKNFDIAFIADLALREKQIQQNYRPIIAVHKWFARRRRKANYEAASGRAANIEAETGVHQI